MESQGSTVAAPLPDKQGQAYSQQPAPGYAPGYNAGQMSQAPVPQVMYPPGQAPPAYSTAPPVQYIIQNPQPLVNPPNDYFIQAILVTVFCFWPTGIIAIIKALDSRRAAQTGDAQNAQLSSQAARKMSLISLFVGIAILVVIAIIIVIELVVVFSLY
ncbi:proline-rich transmembrane protein 1-like [Patiria miniata]|uniref:Proline-rich transmembrane protein 1 n=1 Tax=Patiria miniata TaxID=46514 RepID=A0A913ZPG3_PATMI|nr:proline-rich transmembrane protein 1-like [Patiria miniata]